MPVRSRHEERPGSPPGRLSYLSEIVGRAFSEFLKLPLLIIVVFLLLAAGTSLLDALHVAEPVRSFLRQRFFRDSAATSQLLATIAGSIVTVTSITFSLLLIAIQQAAVALTSEVHDQFLRRRVNQFYFGFFVGLGLYTLVILATVDRPFNPVFGATLALLLMIVALVLLVLLLYTTINQMRPAVVIETIHDHVLRAREQQEHWLWRTRSKPLRAGPAVPVLADAHGYLVSLRLEALEKAVRECKGEVEIVLQVSIGAYLAYRDLIAEVRAADPADAVELVPAVAKALRIERQRDLDTDPAYGVDQLAVIGWTSISTAKSDPAPGLLVVRSFRDLLARWAAGEPGSEIPRRGVPLPLVYSDNFIAGLMDGLETLAVVASESLQAQTAAEIMRALTLLFGRLPAEQQNRADDLIRRSLSALGEHVLTAPLDTALHALVATLDRAGRQETARLVQRARDRLAISIGKLGSRATRAGRE